MLKLKKSLFFALFLVFFGRPAAFGHFPDFFNAGGVINGLFGYRLNFSPNKPLKDSTGAYFEHLGYFCNSQSFHIVIIEKKSKKSRLFNHKLLTKLKTYMYNVSMYRQISSCIGDSLSIIAKYRQLRGDKNMENFDEKLTLEALERELKEIQRDISRYQEWMRDTARIIEVALVRQSIINGFYEERKQGVKNA